MDLPPNFDPRTPPPGVNSVEHQQAAWAQLQGQIPAAPFPMPQLQQGQVAMAPAALPQPGHGFPYPRPAFNPFFFNNQYPPVLPYWAFPPYNDVMGPLGPWQFLPVAQAGPSVPVAQAGPSVPVAQAGPSVPVAQAGPSVQVAQAGPSVPVAQAGPSVQVAQAGPSVPVAQAGPSVQVAQAGPSVPVAQAGPSVPVAQAGPSVQVAQAGPSVPVAQAGPSVQVAQAGPSVPVAQAGPSVPVAQAGPSRARLDFTFSDVEEDDVVYISDEECLSSDFEQQNASKAKKPKKKPMKRKRTAMRPTLESDDSDIDDPKTPARKAPNARPPPNEQSESEGDECVICRNELTPNTEVASLWGCPFHIQCCLACGTQWVSLNHNCYECRREVINVTAKPYCIAKIDRRLALKYKY